MNINIENACRTCLKVHENPVKFEDTYINYENESVAVVEIISLLCDLKENELNLNLICPECIEKVSYIFKFKIQCENVQKQLLQYFQHRKESDTSTEYQLIENFIKDESDITFNDDLNLDSDFSDEVVNIENKVLLERLKKVEIKTNNEESTKLRDDDLDHVALSELVKQEKTKLKVGKKKDKSEIAALHCAKCNKTFKTKYILTVHEKRHLYKGQFLCTTCGKGFNSQSCLKRHARVHTGEKNYRCEICEKTFPSSNNLKLHSRIHTGIKPYLCTMCGKSFSHPTGLTYHVRTHTKEKPYTCEICGKRFAIQCHVDRHRKIHTGERPFPCKQCDRAFIKKIDLQRHEDVHKGIKPHVCSVCNKPFLRKMHLNYHMMVHTEERPHKCPVCDKGFIRRYYLKDHIIKHHGPIENFKLEPDVD